MELCGKDGSEFLPETAGIVFGIWTAKHPTFVDYFRRIINAFALDISIRRTCLDTYTLSIIIAEGECLNLSVKHFAQDFMHFMQPRCFPNGLVIKCEHDVGWITQQTGKNELQTCASCLNILEAKTILCYTSAHLSTSEGKKHNLFIKILWPVGSVCYNI